MSDGVKMTRNELSLAGKLLRMAADKFGNHGCNDFELENTDENWQLIVAMRIWNGDPENTGKRPALHKKIRTDDWYVMAYLAHRLSEET